jgi:hypothetical protein
MNKIGEIVFNDGEVLSSSEFGSDLEFQFKILNSLDFETVRSFFIKKSIIEFVKEKTQASNGSNGATSIELLNIFKFKDIDFYVKELVDKKIIKSKQGVNLEMYFIYKE